MVDYIIIFDLGYKNPDIMLNSNCFGERFSTYVQAKEKAEEVKKYDGCKEYDIYALCSDDKNHVI